ncbi:Ner family transcriptional regulator [Rhizobium leguminosarum]
MTLTALAELNGLDRTACRQVKSKTNRKAEAAIADFLGERVEDLFPDRYPIQTSRILSSEYAAAIASQKKARGANRVAA